MSNASSKPSKAEPHFVILAAEMTVRRALRPFLNFRAPPFFAVLRISDVNDTFLYEEAARRVLADRMATDLDGNESVWISGIDNFRHSPWTVFAKLKHTRAAVCIAGQDEKLNDDFSLLIDVEIAVSRPEPKHIRLAAQRRSVSLDEEGAAYLAGIPLRQVRLAAPYGRPISRVLASLKRKETEPPAAEKAALVQAKVNVKEPTLNDLPGYGEARVWGLQLARDIADWKAGKIGWQDVDRGILLSGPPGCGKTMFAQALAATCGVSLLHASAGKWQAEGHLGDMLKAMRKFFSMASTKSPCIAFLDEFDSFGDRDTRDGRDNDDYKRQVINALLECLDPVEGREGIVVIGATNNAKAIDRALLRPGRLERIVEIHLPDAEDREGILRHHLRDMLKDADLGVVSEMSLGWSGADLAKLARDARRSARLRGSSIVTQEDLLEAIPSSEKLSEADLFRLAVHEAGHAIITCRLQPGNLVSVNIRRSVPPNGGPTDLGGTTLRRSLPPINTYDDMRNRIVLAYGGMVAENIVFGRHSTTVGGRSEADLQVATYFATIMEVSFGFGQSLVSVPDIGPKGMDTLRMYDRNVAEAVSKRLTEYHAVAHNMLLAEKDQLLLIANELQRKSQLTDVEVHELLDQEVSDVQKD